MALNPRQRLFVEAYLLTKSATQAALDAGYKEKAAHAQGSKLLKHPEIKLEIELRMKAEVRRLRIAAEKKGLTRERWVEELAALGLANMDDYATVENGEVKVFDNDKRPGEGAAIKKLVQTKNGVGIELHSKEGALTTVGKHFGWIKEQIEHLPGAAGVPVMVIALPDNGRQAKPEEPKPEEPKNDDGEG